MCKKLLNQGRVLDDPKKRASNEIVLSKTYAYPKVSYIYNQGTYTKESTKFFLENERKLFHLSQGNNISSIRYLTLKSVHINILDQDRVSPLHIASRKGSLQVNIYNSDGRGNYKSWSNDKYT